MPMTTYHYNRTEGGTIGTLYIHHEDILRHTHALSIFDMFAFILAHPNPLGSLPTILLAHNTKLCSEEIIEKGRFTGGLRAEYGYEMVVEARGNNFLDVEVSGDVGARL